MSNELVRIEDQLKRAFEGVAWRGPSVLEVLKDVTASQAAVQPLPNAHRIWDLVLHIAAWEAACRRRLEGDRAELSDTEDWPDAGDTSEAAWERVKALLVEGHHKLRAAIAAADQSRLDEPILPGMPSLYVTLHGVIQHDLYHAGQIAILKKGLSEVKGK